VVTRRPPARRRGAPGLHLPAERQFAAGPKFKYKLAWFERLIAHVAELNAMGVSAVLTGDYNVVPTGQDIYPTTSWGTDALLQRESRAAFQRLLYQGWTEARPSPGRIGTGVLALLACSARARWLPSWRTSPCTLLPTSTLRLRQYSSHRISWQEQAQGFLITALGMLAKHCNYRRVRSGSPRGFWKQTS
jgi:hypothetical protein